MIQGTTTPGEDGDAEIQRQYEEAADFLRKLANNIVGGDLSRVLLVPGNHDVNWSRARASMQPLSACPPAIETEAYQSHSKVRWSWEEQRAYEIVDDGLYASRLDHFQTFRAEFYAGLNPNPLAHTSRGDLVSFDYPHLGLLIVGFPSWLGNDCFCRVGGIDSASLASSREILDKSATPIAVAVWHHSIEGGPGAHDYMDKRVVHRLIDFGFTIGLHGHQHYPEAKPFELRLSGDESMAVVGAGSLAVGDTELPMGERRQYNLVVVDPTCGRIEVHVRGMSPAGVFGASHRDDFGGNSSVTLSLPHSRTRSKRAMNVRLRDQAADAMGNRDYEQVLALLANAESPDDPNVRQLTLEALRKLERHDEVLALTSLPRNADELVGAISLLIGLHRFDEADQMLEGSRELVDLAQCNDLHVMIESGRISS